MSAGARERGEADGGGTAPEVGSDPDGTGTATANRPEAAATPSVRRPAFFETRDLGIHPGRPADPCVMVIFGASGDLTTRFLLPSLFELRQRDLLPDPFAVVGVARSDWDSEAFRERARTSLERNCAGGQRGREEFLERLSFITGDATSEPEDDYADLAEEIGRVRERLSLPDNVFFHLAVPPAFFGTIVERLGASGLAESEAGWRRIAIEKPFGRDRGSARELDRQVRSVFEEEQIYRIDHFLGKETVQNMLVFRLANPSFEPIWNRNYIDHVQITVAEPGGIGARAGFYEETGVVRDMVQNHLLQLLCMAAIEPPVNFDAVSLRDETAKVLQAVNVEPVDIEHGVVRGQYGPGEVDGERVRGYREEEGVETDSDTATFAAIKLTLDNWRWADVPFYLRTGKRMARKLTEVAIHFKPTPHVMFPVDEGDPGRRHVLVFRLQPEEGIIQSFVAKRPGPEVTLCTVRMNFQYADAFGVEEPPRAYAWLLRDVMQGNQTLFARADWIDQAWQIVDPIVERWAEEPAPDFPNYAAGSWGPEMSAEVMKRDGRRWGRS